MARRAEVDAAAVNWSHRHPVIREKLAELATYSLDSIEELKNLL
jgi:phosphoglycolate phosphatase-like HAD superfamily hydrolase